MRTETRLNVALETGMIALPEVGQLAVIGAVAGMDFTGLPSDRCDFVTTLKPDMDFFEAKGWTCRLQPQGRYALVLVIAARARALTLARLAQAAEVCDGVLVVDGAKTDGIETVLKACRRNGETSAPLSKAHGKIFTFVPGPGVSDWGQDEPTRIASGFVTAPGVFSRDAVDPASSLLAAHLPKKLGAEIADLGAGWGYLSHEALTRPDITKLHLVEADFVALDCAKQNVADPRASYHWADATHWIASQPLDSVLMNPPFHIGRGGHPELGKAFIAAASRNLKPRGSLYMVANRHLPYEADLHRHFGQVDNVGSDPRFKIFVASRPARTRP
ncbi:MAG: methyltransferase [Pseudomonadota bacterium]